MDKLLAIVEGGNILAEGVKGYNDVISSKNGSADKASAVLSLSSITSSVVGGGASSPFFKSLSTAFGIKASAWAHHQPG